MESLKHSLWVEKYRPNKLDNYIGNDHLKSKVSVYLESGDVPHLLLFGKAGTGKTTLANELAPMIDARRLNADEVRKAANDWDFSEEGRKMQAKRMASLAIKLKDQNNYVVADFICPTPEARNLFPADYIIWVDTIREGRFDDTNKMFVKPDKFDFHVTSQDAKNWAKKIFKDLKK